VYDNGLIKADLDGCGVAIFESFPITAAASFFDYCHSGGWSERAVVSINTAKTQVTSNSIPAKGYFTLN